MFIKIIESYIKKLTKNDIIVFANKNNINLNNKELNYIYNILKNDYKILLSDDYINIFINAKGYIDDNTLKKIYNLFMDYRSKYLN